MAHAEAARRIEAENNAAKDTWQLDLHGLHTSEALWAVDARQLLYSVCSCCEERACKAH